MSARLTMAAVLCVVAMAVPTPARQHPAAARPASGPRPALPPPLTTLRPHPRLLVTDADLPRIWEALAQDARLRRWRDGVRAEAARIASGTVAADAGAGGSRLEASRAARERITTLAGLFRLDGDRRWLDRAIAEMRAAAAMEHWNPSHFLDTAEMTAGLALGYDWLYADLSAEDRSLIRRAIIDKGIAPGADLIDRGVLWAREPRHLWTEVCLGGLALGALAVAEDAPQQAARILAAVRGDGLRQRLAMYSPDGADREGVGYWDHTTRYTIWLLAALETALGADFGLAEIPGLAGIGSFRMYALGPSRAIFNYGDARERTANAPQMFWLSGRYDRPEYAAHERNWLRRSPESADILHILWAPRVPAREPTAPTWSRRFNGVELAVLRGDWRDPRASWVGFKGGHNGSAQAHLDLGAFVVDAVGERWAVDLGAGDFALPGYFGEQRWSYLPARTDGHNTLVVNGGNQNRAAGAPLVAFGDDSYRSFAVVDLSAAYAPAVASARRGVALIDGRDVLIQDEIDGAGSAELTWQMLTRASVSPDGARAVLRQNGKTIVLRVVEPTGASLRTAAPEVKPPEAEQPDVTVIRVTPPARADRVRFVVWLSSGDRPAPDVTPLDEWRQPK